MNSRDKVLADEKSALSCGKWWVKEKYNIRCLGGLRGIPGRASEYRLGLSASNITECSAKTGDGFPEWVTSMLW